MLVMVSLFCLDRILLTHLPGNLDRNLDGHLGALLLGNPAALLGDLVLLTALLGN